MKISITEKAALDAAKIVAVGGFVLNSAIAIKNYKKGKRAFALFLMSLNVALYIRNATRINQCEIELSINSISSQEDQEIFREIFADNGSSSN